MSYYTLDSAVEVHANRIISYECENCGENHSHKEPFKEIIHKKFETSKNQEIRAHDAKLLNAEVQEEAISKFLEIKQNKLKIEGYKFVPCPNCGFIQSWMNEDYIDSRMYPIVVWPLAIIAVIFLIGMLVLNDEYYLEQVDWWGSMSQFLRCFSGFSVWLIISVVLGSAGGIFIKFMHPNRVFPNPENKKEPSVVWDEPFIS